MTMTEYFPLSPIGVGNWEIEAFGSFYCRMARAHSVSIYVLTTHLRTWWRQKHPDDDSAKKNVTNAMNPMLRSIGPNVATFTNIVGDATGCTILERTTLLSLRPAISQNGHALVRKGRAWCPACMAESMESKSPFYDRLIWAIPAIKNCPAHKVALESKCPQCGYSQAHYHHLGHMELCCVCKRPLLSEPSRWEVAFHPAPYEKECIRLVKQISAGDLTSAVDDAYGVFIKDFADYLSPIGLKISRHTYRAPRRPQNAREVTRPRFMTLLRRCVAFGIDPSDLFLDPVGAAKSACLLEFARLDLPADIKPRKSVELVGLALDRLQSELSKSDYDQLPSLTEIAHQLGVSKGFLNYHHGDLCAKYARHRTGCRNKKAGAEIERSTHFLLSGPIAQYPSGKFPSLDHLAEAAVQELGVGVRIARIAVGVALKKQFGRREATRRRKASI
ncbi:TniQ protein [Lysobacter sp. yr284]|uniref:TniQ family protein n=1 Tax=Lysobacter sp. yr284 TaxID=1761791 RepID=UPI000895369E|nr:TniQ family protein [Lysobacter sp. yr284]SDZ17455.1 TniQ protein [Lysobacter sp. yr284]